MVKSALRPPLENCTAGSSGPLSGVKTSTAVPWIGNGYGASSENLTAGCAAGSTTPDGSMNRAAGAAGMLAVRLNEAVAVNPAASVAVALMVEVPGCFTDPASAPVAGSRVNPSGVPLADHR